MDVHEHVRSVVAPVLASLDVELFEVEVRGAGPACTVRLLVDRDGGVDLETITEVTRSVSPVLDAEDPVPGSYTLEVSSPGLERPLTRPEHFRKAVGETVSVKTHDEVEGARRHRGELLGADDDGVDVEVEGAERRLHFEEIEKARTVFEWGPAPKPGSKGSKGSKAKSKKRTKTR